MDTVAFADFARMEIRVGKSHRLSAMTMPISCISYRLMWESVRCKP